LIRPDAPMIFSILVVERPRSLMRRLAVGFGCQAVPPVRIQGKVLG
jgi:hypothetical protein